MKMNATNAREIGREPDAQAVRPPPHELSDETARSRRPAVAAAAVIVIVCSGANTPQASVTVGLTPGKLAAARDA